MYLFELVFLVFLNIYPAVSVLLDQGSTLVTSFNLNHPLKGLISNTSRVRLQRMNLGVTQFSP